jgi:hypothetical protein
MTGLGGNKFYTVLSTPVDKTKTVDYQCVGDEIGIVKTTAGVYED